MADDPEARWKTVDVGAFAETAGARIVLEHHWCVLAVGEKLLGYAAWGSLELADLDRIFDLFDRVLKRVHRIDFVIDGSRNRAHVINPIIDRHFLTLARERIDLFDRRVADWVLIPPPLPIAVLASGAAKLIGLRNPFRVELSSARTWAEMLPEVEGEGRLSAELTSLFDHLAERTVLEHQVRTQLRLDLAASLEQTASQIGLGPRTLQRELLSRGSTFRSIKLREQLDRAANALASENKISEVAAQCGFRSVSHFSEVFRKAFRVTPARARRLLLGADRYRT